MSIPSRKTIESITEQAADGLNWGKYGVEPLDTGPTNIVALGPVQEFSEIEAGLILLLFAKLMKTPEGQKHAVSIINKYFDTMTQVIINLNKSSATHPWNNMINQLVSTQIYERIGLMNSAQALQTKLWIDHVLGEAIKTEYVMKGLEGLVTLVDASSYKAEGKEYAGLATLAKVLGK